MKKNRKTSWAIMLIFLFSIFVPLGAAGPVSADVIDDVAAELQSIYPFVDDADKADIRTARGNLATVTAGEWDTVVVPLLTDDVKAKYSTEAAAKTAMINFAKGWGDIYYSADAAELANTLRTFKDNFKTDFDKLFNPAGESEITMDALYQLLQDSRNQLPAVIQGSASYINDLANGTNTTLVATMPDVIKDAMIAALDLPGNALFRGRLSAIGWSAATLIDQQQALANIIDQDKKAQLALAKAAVRSETKIYYGEQELTTNALALDRRTLSSATFELKIMGKTATGLVDWNSSNPAVASLNDSGKGNILTLNADGNTIITAYRNAGGVGTPASDWLIKLNVAISTSSGGGGGGGTTPSTPGTVGSDSIDKQTSTTSTGQTVETFTVKESATNQINQAKSAGKNTVEIQIDSSATASTVINIPPEVLTAASGLNTVISTPNAALELPKTLVEALANAGQALTITVERGDSNQVQNQMQGVEGTEGAAVLGNPVEINTELKGNTTVSLPLTGITIPQDAAAQKAFLDSLAIFVIHSDGSKEIIMPTIVRDSAGNPTAVNFNVDKFSTFAIIQQATGEVPLVLSDIAGHWAEANIKKMVESGVISGYPDKTFRPNNSISRAEFATVIVKALKLESKTGKVFSDTADSWAKDYIATANAHGIISGYSETLFGPEDPITREQMASIAARALKLSSTSDAKVFTDDSKISAWAQEAVEAVSAAGIISGYPDGTFRPQGKTARAEAVTVLAKIVEYIAQV